MTWGGHPRIGGGEEMGGPAVREAPAGPPDNLLQAACLHNPQLTDAPASRGVQLFRLTST